MREHRPWTNMLLDGREPRRQELVTADYDFDTYLDIMAHPGTPFGKLEYIAAAALYGMRLLVHIYGRKTVAFGSAKEFDHI